MPEEKEAAFHLTSEECVRAQCTLVIEAVDTVDGGTLVIASQKKEIFWVFDFVGQEKTDRLQALLATINVVAEE